MNLILLDMCDEFSDADVTPRLTAIAGQPVKVCRMTRSVGPNGPPQWSLQFAPDELVRTQLEPEGILCAALLTCDQFDESEELVVLSASSSEWAIHLERLHDARARGLDVFLSFDLEAPARLTLDPDHSALLRVATGVSTGLAWYRTAKLFYDSAKQVIRKDSRWNGQYTSDSLLREVLLNDARIGYFGRTTETAAA